ncbi:MAG: T9SS C-terminal target domain-containing protein [Bacteroidetes bacterium]|nr:MAG: T9SS C-terminal target domain-containing protein [Bacteroidota bacterium]
MEGEHTLNLSTMAPGLYLIRVDHPQGRLVRKVIIE